MLFSTKIPFSVDCTTAINESLKETEKSGLTPFAVITVPPTFCKSWRGSENSAINTLYKNTPTKHWDLFVFLFARGAGSTPIFFAFFPLFHTGEMANGNLSIQFDTCSLDSCGEKKSEKEEMESLADCWNKAHRERDHFQLFRAESMAGAMIQK